MLCNGRRCCYLVFPVPWQCHLLWLVLSCNLTKYQSTEERSRWLDGAQNKIRCVVLRTGGGFGQPAWRGRSSEDSCKSPLQLLHIPSADTKARVLCGERLFCAVKSTECFGAVTIRLVRV